MIIRTEEHILRGRMAGQSIGCNPLLFAPNHTIIEKSFLVIYLQITYRHSEAVSGWFGWFKRVE